MNRFFLYSIENTINMFKCLMDKLEYKIDLFDKYHLAQEYSPEIYMYLLEFEKRYRPNPGYMLNQTYIDFKMRSILIDWMVEVSVEWKLTDDTLFLSINIIDRLVIMLYTIYVMTIRPTVSSRFLSRIPISNHRFQLLGKLFQL
jgi:Cyclin, N-terminal domain